MKCKSIMILLFIIIFNRLETLLSLTWIAQVSEEEVFHTTWKWQNTTISVVPPPLLHLPTPKFECGVSSTFTIKPYWNHVIRTFVVLIIDVFLTYTATCVCSYTQECINLNFGNCCNPQVGADTPCIKHG